MTAPTPQRRFLDWTRPALAAAVDHLLEVADAAAQDHAPNSTDHASPELDLSHLLIVLPGGRAARRMLELLVSTCEARNRRLVPPRLMTLGHLPEHLYTPAAPVASPLTRSLLFADAVRAIDRDLLRAIAPTPPADHDTAAWAAIAQMVERLHNELAAAHLRFADVPDLAEQALPDFADHARFEALAAIQTAYFDLLDQLNLDDPQRARLRALEEKACTFDGPIYLVAINYLPPVVRAMLEQTSAQITALIAAPAERADAFDALGCLDAAAWADAHIPIDEQQVDVVARPVDQAAAVLSALQSLHARYSAEQITVGVCDTSLTPYLQQHLPAYDVPVRDAAGTPLARTGPYRLLAAVADYLEQQRFGDFAALLRHPDLAHYLLAQPEPSEIANPRSLDAWLDILDRYFNEHLQGRVSTPWLGNGELREQMRQVHETVHADELLGPLTRGKRPLREWASPILQLLRTLYAAAPLSRDDHAQRLTIEACQRLHATLTQLHDLPSPPTGQASERETDAASVLSSAAASTKSTTATTHDSITHRPSQIAQQTTASEAIRTVLRQAASEAIPPEPREAAVELLGPLELLLDDAPVLLITGVNEGKLPESVNADAFLPNTLRAAIGLEDNDRRYARDAYALTAIVHSRPHVRLIAGRRDASGDPLAPSRLLFADEPHVIADRVARFYGETAPIAPPPPPPSLRPADCSGFVLPPPLPAPLRDFSHMAVTEFRLYLQCPYRYYLQRGLRLRAMDDAAAELDALNFGTLAHDVLQQFGESDAAHATDPAVITAALREILHETARRRFGSAPLPAVRVQVKQLENRLHRFADRQADWAQKGWRIKHVELDVNDPAAAVLDVDETPMPLRGRIDRLDENEITGQLALLDYKTGDNGQTPEATHRAGPKKNRHWVDLQLPLYRHLLPAVASPASGSEREILLGYILLPRDTRATGFSLADWTADELAIADDTARHVVRQIRACNFEHDPTRPPPRFDPFATICGTDQLTSDDTDEDE